VRKCQRHAQLQAAHCLARGFHSQERSFQLCATSWADAGFARAAGRSGSGRFSCALRSSARSPSFGQHLVAGSCYRTRCHIKSCTTPALRAELAARALAARGAAADAALPPGPPVRFWHVLSHALQLLHRHQVCSACGVSSSRAAAALAVCFLGSTALPGRRRRHQIESDHGYTHSSCISGTVASPS
jgi:hypothetical protein